MPAPVPSEPLHTVQSFAQLSRFLREDGADEETRQLRESLGGLSRHIEAAVQARRKAASHGAVIASVRALAAHARQHQLLLTGMGSAWHALYEFGGYQRGLRELRDSIARWQAALEAGASAEQECFAAFELLAWRTLGDALLVIDMYEQGGVEPQSDAPARRRAPLLVRLGQWLARGGRRKR